MLRLAKNIAAVAVMSALLITGKFVLSFVPNVEVVTLFTVVFTAAFGLSMSLPAVLVFVLLDPILYPTTLTVIVLYFTYYPLLACVAALITRGKAKSGLAYAIMSIPFGVFFALYSCLLDYALMGIPFAPAAVAGIPFMVLNVVSNFFILLLLFRVLYDVLARIRRSMKLGRRLPPLSKPQRVQEEPRMIEKAQP